MGSRRVGLARTSALIENLKRSLDLNGTILTDVGNISCGGTLQAALYGDNPGSTIIDQPAPAEYTVYTGGPDAATRIAIAMTGSMVNIVLPGGAERGTRMRFVQTALLSSNPAGGFGGVLRFDAKMGGAEFVPRSTACTLGVNAGGSTSAPANNRLVISGAATNSSWGIGSTVDVVCVGNGRWSIDAVGQIAGTGNGNPYTFETY